MAFQRPPPPPHLSTTSPSSYNSLFPFLSTTSTSTSTSRFHDFHHHSYHRNNQNRRLSLLFTSSPFSPSRSQRVSTAPVKQAPSAPPPPSGFDAEIARLAATRSRLRDAATLSKKLHVLDSDPGVRNFFGEAGHSGILVKLQPYEVFLLKCLVLVGQEHVLGTGLDSGGSGGGAHHTDGLKQALHTLGDFIEKWGLEEKRSEEMELLNKLLRILGEMEQFYDCIGGIIG